MTRKLADRLAAELERAQTVDPYTRPHRWGPHDKIPELQVCQRPDCFWAWRNGRPEPLGYCRSAAE